MYKLRFLSLLLITSSAEAMEHSLFTWDDRELATGLHVSAAGKDQQDKPWTVREIQIKDTPFYQDLFSNENVVKTIDDGRILSPEQAANSVKIWSNGFAQGIPSGRMIIEQDKEAVGCVQVGWNNKRLPGFGELARVFKPSAQGKGLGKATLEFLVEEWAPAVRKIGLNQSLLTPFPATEKFKCFGGKELEFIGTMARPSNIASWKSYKSFGFVPSSPTDNTLRISCEGWEESLHGPLEKYIIDKYFASTSSDRLLTDVLYDMLDENGKPRTLSFVDAYGSLRYHFVRRVD